MFLQNSSGTLVLTNCTFVFILAGFEVFSAMLITPGADMAKLTQACAGLILCFLQTVKNASRQLKRALFSVRFTIL